MLRIPHNKVAITPIYDPRESRGGIIIPDMARERCDQGIVKYVGKNVDMTYIKPGDYVFFGGYTGTLFSVEGEGNLIIMPEEFIIAVLEGTPDELTVPGLYLCATGVISQEDIIDSIYFPAPYRDVINLISQAITDSDWIHDIKVKAENPKLEEYERLR